jgi:DNA-directed RNA polymerase alpha subunit
MANKKTIREQSIDELLPFLLLFGKGQLSKLEQNLLAEVLLNGKQFKDLTSTLQLTTTRQKQIFDNAINRLMKALVLAIESEKANAYSVMEKELHEVKSNLAVLKINLKQQNELSQEMKELLATPIHKTGLSARVKNLCYNAKIDTVTDLIRYSRRDFTGLRGSGQNCGNEVELFLENNGLSWK